MAGKRGVYTYDEHGDPSFSPRPLPDSAMSDIAVPTSVPALLSTVAALVRNHNKLLKLLRDANIIEGGS